MHPRIVKEHPMKRKRRVRRASPRPLDKIHPHAAGIDIGAETHWVAVPEAADPEPVRKFGSVTGELHRLADWLLACGIETVAMESTGVYWIPLYEILEARGLEVLLVNARHVKNVPGRKTDVLDCQWLQQLHSFGLLRGSFRPTAEITALRTYLRHRETLARAASFIHRIQKSLDLMHLPRVPRLALPSRRDPRASARLPLAQAAGARSRCAPPGSRRAPRASTPYADSCASSAARSRWAPAT
jgi:transposase